MVDLLEIEQLNFTVDQEKILSDITFSIQQGERLSIQGPSGGGKSTLLKIMAGLSPYSSGTIYFKGKDITTLDYDSYRQQVSYVHQTPTLFGDSVEDNLAFPARIRHDAFDSRQAKAYLKDLGLENIALDKDIHSLSGGEKQRISLIRHLIYPPQILLLDEITASLDHHSTKKIWAWIEDQASQHGIALVWISHKSDEQARADRNLVIENGQIIKDSKGGQD